MMLPFQLLSFGFALVAAAQSNSEVIILSAKDSITSTDGLPAGTHSSMSSTITFTTSGREFGTMTTGENAMGTANATSSSITSNSRTELRGSSRTEMTSSSLNGTATGNSSATASSTSSSAEPINTTPCNGYPELCNRRYSNITNVMAHNSPFIGESAADNQNLPVTTQLDDGIRGLQIQAHIVNGTVYMCHTTCDILNAGTLTSYLNTVNTWVQSHPYDVITILLGNAEFNPVTDYVSAIEASGITQYAYEPPKEPMAIDDWPTLGAMILTSKRVVIFMDYQANQTEVPWILVEFEQVWETPFDPTDLNFPCMQQRPPGLTAEQQHDRMYLMNHNLNQNVSLLGVSLSIPNKPLLPQTNNVSGFGSLGLASNNCYTKWGRAPNFLNVDYYNNGSGTVFEVAAKWNNVTYTAKCCGLVSASSAKRALEVIGRTMSLIMIIGVFWAWMLM